MEKFTVPIRNFVIKRSFYFDRIKWDEAEKKLNSWKNYLDKHHISFYYKDQYFGFVYTKSLYRCRVESFYEVLKMISHVSGVKEVLMKNFSIVSVGCGPGPEIAAYVVFLRDQLNVCSTLNFIGIDRIEYWREFLMQAEKCDQNINILFENSEFNEYYLQRSNLHGICIMSYPESVLFTNNIWIMLKTKFDLIIVLDQSKPELQSKLRNAGFTRLGFHYLQMKWFSYYLNTYKSTQRYENNNYFNLSSTRSFINSDYYGNKTNYPLNCNTNSYLNSNRNINRDASSNIKRNFKSNNENVVAKNYSDLVVFAFILLVLFIIMIVYSVL